MYFWIIYKLFIDFSILCIKQNTQSFDRKIDQFKLSISIPYYVNIVDSTNGNYYKDNQMNQKKDNEKTMSNRYK